MGTIDANGCTLYYEESGAGPALLFIHGMAGSAAVWADQRSRLDDAFRTVAYDRRGHTRSPKPADSPAESVELHADDAAALIRALDLAPVILVGSSGGARIGIDLLRRYPGLVRGAVLSEPPVFSLSPSIGEEFVARVKPSVGQALASEDPTTAVDAFFGVIDHDFWAGAPAERKAAYRRNLPAMMADLQMPDYRLSVDDLATIDRPCLVLTGGASLSWFQDIAAIVAQGIPGARLKILDGAGHATYVARPAEFARSVRDFATSLRDEATQA